MAREPLMIAYAEMCGPKATPGGRQRWYRIYLDANKPSGDWIGPFRDETDAKNAAHEEAERRNLILEWLY